MTDNAAGEGRQTTQQPTIDRSVGDAELRPDDWGCHTAGDGIAGARRAGTAGSAEAPIAVEGRLAIT